MKKTPQHLPNTNRVSEVPKRIDSIEGHGREARKMQQEKYILNCSQASLLSIPKNEGLKW
jgi:hypothetical protein